MSESGMQNGCASAGVSALCELHDDNAAICSKLKKKKKYFILNELF